MASMVQRSAVTTAPVVEMEEGTKMTSSLRTVKPREVRYEPPIEIIFDRYG